MTKKVKESKIQKQSLEDVYEIEKIKPYDVKAYKVVPYSNEEIEMLARGEKVLTAEEMEEQEISES